MSSRQLIPTVTKKQHLQQQQISTCRRSSSFLRSRVSSCKSRPWPKGGSSSARNNRMPWHMAQQQLTEDVLISTMPPNLAAVAATSATNSTNPASIFGSQPHQDSRTWTSFPLVSRLLVSPPAAPSSVAHVMIKIKFLFMVLSR